MDVKDLKKIVEIMNENDLVEIEIEEEGKRLRLRKHDSGMVAAPSHPPALAAVAPPGPLQTAAAAAAAATPPPSAEPALHTISAPMVGTFYRAPSADADAYVEIGSRVSPESVVCILEAMKVMNEIKAECSGEIVKVCVQNAEAVEYGQPLFLVKPA